ncbi:lantibiotic immunity ABC transporter MutE/EpiE family permease subunit [Bacillus spizizenii]|nr:lantibiotic immunity ABC transporter MutE/EpiE family permease subunit [Bacillus spizizenii]
MINYIKAENLKFKRTFSRKMIIFVPLLNIGFSFLMNTQFFVPGTYNWWSIIFMPVMIALFCSLSHQKEKKASHYNGTYSLPIDLGKLWYAKIIIIAIYSLLSQVVFLVFMLLMGFVIADFSIISPSIVAASLLLWLTSLWQILLCLFVAKKWGFTMAVMLNFIGTLVLGVMPASRAFWWFIPWSWPIRMMCPTIGIHPNGLLLENNDPLLSWMVVPPAIVISILFFLILAFLTSRSFAPTTDYKMNKREAM